MSLGMETVDDESYCDRQTYTRVGAYTSTVNKMFYPFAKPQDCGNLTGVKWIRLDNKTTSTATGSTRPSACRVPTTPIT